MTGDIAKAILLTTYGTAYMQDNYDIGGLTLEHPTFKFTNKVEFLIAKKRWFRKPIWETYANDVIDWLNKLKKEGCREIRFVYEHDNSVSLDGTKVPDHKLAAFVGGGGSRYIATVFDNHTDYWKSREEVTDQDDPDRKIWTVSYGRVLYQQTNQQKTTYDVSETKDKLRKTLTEISNSAKGQKFEHWAKIFDEAKSLLDSPKPFSDYYNGMVPTDRMSLTTLQLLAASRKAWVFGGMGSWNDLWCEDKEAEKEYDRLSAELYDIVNESYVVVANSYDKKK